MKEMLVGLAEYNQKANAKLIEILGKAPEAVLVKDMGSYYKSVLGTLEHVLIAEIAWLKRFNGFFSYPSLAKAWLVTTEGEEAKAKAQSGPQQLFAILREADALLVDFAHELDEGDLTALVSFKTFRGEGLQRRYWNTIIHILNHGTHHRGEVSAMLDMQGVANDFSGFNQYMS
jgi:uncharacterized damage-inducible protein DinB